MTACKVLAMQAGEEETKQRLLEPEAMQQISSNAIAPQNQESLKTKNPNNKKRLNRQEPPKKGSGSRGPASSYPCEAKPFKGILTQTRAS